MKDHPFISNYSMHLYRYTEQDAHFAVKLWENISNNSRPSLFLRSVFHVGCHVSGFY